MNEETAKSQTPDLTEEEKELESLDKTDEQDSDPLDEINDIDELRSKTKGYRSAFKKWKGKAKEVKPEVKAEPKIEPKVEIPTDIVRKSDLTKVATNQAKELVGAEALEVWDELMKIPLEGFDPLDPKSIASNIKERFGIYKQRNPEKDSKPDTTSITSTNVSQGTGGGQTVAPKIKTPKKPEDWYPKKEE